MARLLTASVIATDTWVPCGHSAEACSVTPVGHRPMFFDMWSRELRARKAYHRNFNLSATWQLLA
jgi:hypothetical protein